MARRMLAESWSSDMSTWPTATARHRTCVGGGGGGGGGCGCVCVCVCVRGEGGGGGGEKGSEMLLLTAHLLLNTNIVDHHTFQPLLSGHLTNQDTLLIRAHHQSRHLTNQDTPLSLSTSIRVREASVHH